MKTIIIKNSFIIGTAIFAMYFGAGNFALPMLLGKNAPFNFWSNTIGFCLTAIIVPTIALIAMLYLRGDYKSFLMSIGKYPGYILMVILMAFIGPLAAMPRCIAVSHSAISYHFPSIKSLHFSIIVCIFIFIFSIKKTEIITILGKFLTPILLLSIILIIIFSIVTPTYERDIISKSMHLSPHISFYKALSLGTHTLDLFASFFFACILIPSFKKALKNNKNNQHMNFFTLVTSSCFIGMGLLSMIYLSLIGLSCKYHNIIKTIQTGEELPAIAGELVGKIGAITAAIAIIFACLTTAIALAVVFSEFIEKEILKNKIPYILILFITMSITCGLASLGFDVIVKTIGKMLLAIYPATCILFICNLAKKTIGFPWVKIPFYITLLISLPKRYFCG